MQIMKDHSKSNLWYTRRGAVVEGPYPAGQISRYLLLGRLRISDEVSQDGKTWFNIMQRTDLVPELILSDESEERLRLSRMHEDERMPGNRRDERDTESAEAHERRAKKERRRPEDNLTEEQREHRFRRWKALNRIEKPTYLLTALVSLMFVTLVVIVFLVFAGKHEIKEPNCNAPPGPGVNWRNCQLEGVQAQDKNMRNANLYNATLTGAHFSGTQLEHSELSYASLGLSDFSNADLSDARLFGAYLERANLSGADLRDANLSYAILRHADLEGVKLTGARLDNAIWVDGQTCQPGSVGECLVSK